ncbi:hypothetical protein ACH5RR_003919 [Cinchona calisaya]|uniref:Yippee domain-containing protein n=1 Tax=Cinchona calisaya TaxID=153742 RepID=A0ABD3AWM9_9GENT
MRRLFTVTLSSLEVGDRYYACRICKTQIAPSDELIPSLDANCVLFPNPRNVSHSDHTRPLDGGHTIKDLYCVSCGQLLGQKFIQVGAQPAVDDHMGHVLHVGAMQFQLSKLQQYRMELVDGKLQGVIFVPNQNPNPPLSYILDVAFGAEEDFPGVPVENVDYIVQEPGEQAAAADLLELLDDHHHHQQEAHHQQDDEQVAGAAGFHWVVFSDDDDHEQEEDEQADDLQHVEGAHEVEHLQEDNQAEDVLAEDIEAAGFHLELVFGDDHEQEEDEQANDLQEDNQGEDVVAVNIDVQPQDEEAHHEEAHQAENLQPEEEGCEGENVAAATIGEVHDGVPPQDEENDCYAPNCCCCCC